MQGETLKSQRNSSWSNTLVKTTLICGGCVAILLPAWIPDRNSAQLSRGTVELLQALLLAAAAAVMLGGSPHAGHNRPVCRVLTIGLLIALVGEIDDFVTDILGRHFPEVWIVAVLLVIAIISIAKPPEDHAALFLHLGKSRGLGVDRLGAADSLRVQPRDRQLEVLAGDAGQRPSRRKSRGSVESYLELLACYLIFIGALGLSITLARRKELF